MKPVSVPQIQDPTPCERCPIRARALFQVVSDDYLREAQQRRVGQYRLRAKEHLYRENDEAPLAYTVYEGWLLLYRPVSDGARQGLRVALPGDFIGYRELHGSRVSHSAVALTAATLCGFRHQDLERMLHDHPRLAIQLANFQQRDMTSCQSHMLGLGRKRAEGRVAFLLLELYHRMRLRGAAEGNSIPFPLTQEVIGDLTGLTVVHTNRVMQRLRAAGLLSCAQRKLEILDEAELAKIGEFDVRVIESEFGG
jgi:CRP/FNR family transcriptional regulator